MELQEVLNQVVKRLQGLSHPTPMMTRRLEPFVGIGVVTPDECWTILFTHQDVQLEAGTKNASVVVQAMPEDFIQLCIPRSLPDVDDLKQIHITPIHEWYTLNQFAELLEIQVDVTAFLQDKPFGMPIRYPVGENRYLSKPYQKTSLPAYNRDALPQMIWEGRDDVVAMYDFAWQTAFENLRQPTPESGFVSNFIDTAFNGNLFMWDSCFILLFGRYGRGVFDFMGTLDNFYAKQHGDGFICREINIERGYDLFTPHDPRSTGPNIMAWVEWLDFQQSHDLERLKAVFPALMALHGWWQDWRRWSHGGYWATGWASGMDNQNRVSDSDMHHQHYTWVDATMQQALNCKMLLNIAQAIDNREFDDLLQAEYEQLSDYINQNLWDESSGFYYDLSPEGELSTVKSIGVYWGVLADVIPPQRQTRLLEHLQDVTSFNRPHRIPSQAADSEGYTELGNYWLGGVWAPTNYMVLRGLAEIGAFDLAYEIAKNHVENVVSIFQETGTLWENYSPELLRQGQPAKPDFVGWTGLSAISIPLEFLLGIRNEADTLIWHIQLLEGHGVKRYPIGLDNVIELYCAPRNQSIETPKLEIATTKPIKIKIVHAQNIYNLALSEGKHIIDLTSH